jgi:hypothetical protein
MVSHPVPFRKPIEPEKERMPLNFDRPEPSTGKRLGAGHQCAPGMAPKPRDPAVDAAIEAYLAKHRNRTRLALPLSVEGLPSGRQLKQAAQMQSKFLLHDANGKVVRPQQIDHSAIANELETFPWKDGITRIPTGFATTKYGRAAALAFAGYAPAKGLRVAYDRQANADHQHYRRRQAAGSSGHNSAQEVRAAVYSDGSNLSLLGGFSTLLPMPADRYCAYTKCTNGSFAGRPCRAALDPDRHIDVKYCDRDCAQKHRRLLAKDKTRVANEPLKPQIFCVIEEPANDVIDIVDVYSPVKPDVICENTYREGSRNFRDDPIGQLAAHGEITEAQYNARSSTWPTSTRLAPDYARLTGTKWTSASGSRARRTATRCWPPKSSIQNTRRRLPGSGQPTRQWVAKRPQHSTPRWPVTRSTTSTCSAWRSINSSHQGN